MAAAARERAIMSASSLHPFIPIDPYEESCRATEYEMEQEIARLREMQAYRDQNARFLTVVLETRGEVRQLTAQVARLLEIIAGEIGSGNR